ncbi:MAG: type IV pilus modification protein PilV [Desulfuromonadales bacterium]|nr:type IV pilus modification protein PilV [Desulfuromonadales bacterium]
MMSVAKKSQAGFTLIELLVAVVILAVGLLGLAQLQVTAIQTNSQSSTKTAATSLAQQAIERIMAWDADDPRLDASGTGSFPSVTVAGAGTYTINWEVTTPYEGVFLLCRVDVTVQSTSDVMHVLGNRTRTVTAHTFKRAI